MYLVLGSCRVVVTMHYSKYNCINTCKPLGTRNLHPKCILGRGWSINEHCEMIRLLLGFKQDTEYVGDMFSYEDIQHNIEYIKTTFNDIKGIIVEVSSLKYARDPNGKLIHNLTMGNRTVKMERLSEEEMMVYLREFVQLLPNKKIYFVNHFLHTKIPDRLLIDKCLHAIKNDNVVVITPSDLFTDNPSDFLSDDSIHYKNEEIKQVIARYIDDIIEQTEG